MYFPLRFLFDYNLWCLCLLLAQTFSVDGKIYCSARRYGSPAPGDCSAALQKLPGLTVDQWFVEQQGRTIMPTNYWRPFLDGRPSEFREPIVQMPKWWSYRTCNVALVMYGYADGKLPLTYPVAFLKWSDIKDIGYQVARSCVDNNLEGGASEVFNSEGREAISLFMWQDGAFLDTLMNRYMSLAMPKGLNPSQLQSPLENHSLLSGLEMTNATSFIMGLPMEDGSYEEDVTSA